MMPSRSSRTARTRTASDPNHPALVVETFILGGGWVFPEDWNKKRLETAKTTTRGRALWRTGGNEMGVCVG